MHCLQKILAARAIAQLDSTLLELLLDQLEGFKVFCVQLRLEGVEQGCIFAFHSLQRQLLVQIIVLLHLLQLPHQTLLVSERLVLLHDRDILALNALILRKVETDALLLLVLLHQLLSMVLALSARAYVLGRRRHILRITVQQLLIV